MVFSLKKYLK
jgi:hypothetical protein